LIEPYVDKLNLSSPFIALLAVNLSALNVIVCACLSRVLCRQIDRLNAFYNGIK